MMCLLQNVQTFPKHVLKLGVVEEQCIVGKCNVTVCQLNSDMLSLHMCIHRQTASGGGD